MKINKVKTAIGAITIMGATAATVLIPASPAVAFSSGGVVLDVLVQSPAQLLAKGAAVALPIEYTCSGVTNPEVIVGVTERVGNGAIASGSGSLINSICNGEIQSVTIDVTAAGPKAFTKGTAFATASIFGCGNICGQETDSRTITIQR